MAHIRHCSDIILSMTRTSRVGYLRDIRRMTVALSRARLGLYVVGRRDVFANCYELKRLFAPLLARPDKLVLVSGEYWPSSRENKAPNVSSAELGEGMAESVIEGVEHLGQYVFTLTNERVKTISQPEALLRVAEEEQAADTTDIADSDEEDEGDAGDEQRGYGQPSEYGDEAEIVQDTSEDENGP